MQEEVNVSTTDNNVSLDEQIEGILNENDTPPEENKNEPADTNTDEQDKTDNGEDNQDNTIKCPEKFLNQDGTVNVDNLLKSYSELEPLLNQKAEWEKEKAELQQQADYAKQMQTQAQAQAQNLGYQNPDELALVLEVANAQANEYMKYLHLVGEPDKVRGLLALYAKAPSPELLEQIEDEFNVDVVKRVSILSERVKNQVLQHQEAQRLETIKQEAETFVNNSIKDFPDWFKIPEFTNFFADALRVKGDRFQTADFIKHIENLKTHFYKEFLAEQKTNKENENELNTLKNLTPKTTPKNPVTKNIDDYTPEELDKAIDEFI